MQDHIHLRQSGSRIIVLLSVDAHSMLRFICCFQQKRTRTAGGIIDGLILAFGVLNAYHISQDSGNFSRCIELTFTLPLSVAK